MAQSQYQISAPAMAAARVLWKNLEFRERGKTVASENNVATLIDLFSQAFRLEAALERFVNTVQWIRKEELAATLESAREALRALELVREGLPRFEERSLDGPTAPAVAAANALFQHFVILHRPGSRIRLPKDYMRPSPTERNVAKAIDNAMSEFRVERVIDSKVREVLGASSSELLRNLDTLRNTVRAIEQARNYTPKYAKPPMYVRQAPQVEPPKLSPEQKRYLGHVSEALKKAATWQEHQAVLHKARSDQQV